VGLCPSLWFLWLIPQNQQANNRNLLAEAARSAQIPLFTCLLEFRERENRSREVIDTD
jgi:hypothetical protein